MVSAHAPRSLYPPPGSSNPAEPSSGTNRHGTVRDRTGPSGRRSTISSHWSLPRPHRDDETSAGRELRVERVRDRRSSGGDDDPGERRPLGHAERTVPDPDVDALVAGTLERAPRLLRELRDALDRHDLVGELGEQGRLVAGTRADVERAAPVEPERLEHRRDHVRLRDRLPRTDRERAVGVGVPAETLRHEQLARHGRDRRQHSLVADPPHGHEPRELRPVAHAFAGVRAYGGAGTPKWSSTAGITSTIEAGRTSSPTVSIGTSESPVRSDPCEPPPE